jgi:hypothetical protein
MKTLNEVLEEIARDRTSEFEGWQEDIRVFTAVLKKCQKQRDDMYFNDWPLRAAIANIESDNQELLEILEPKQSKKEGE